MSIVKRKYIIIDRKKGKLKTKTKKKKRKTMQNNQNKTKIETVKCNKMMMNRSIDK